MSALWQARGTPAHWLTPMTSAHLDAVMAIERTAYAVPWTRGNFIDSLASDCFAQCLLDPRGALLGYFVAMRGAGEMHLLNLTVVPAAQGQGHARRMLATLVAAGQADGMAQLWLEVRAGNVRARRLYRHFGMAEVGLRKGYYPTAGSGSSAVREDAVVMSLTLSGGA